MALLISGSAVFAQGAKVMNAYNYLSDGEFIKAIEQIEPATEHEKTKYDGKTWYYRGRIYEQIYFSEDVKYAELKDGSLLKAIESYEKAKELGSKRISMNELNDRYIHLSALHRLESANKVIELNPNSADAYKNRGYAKFDLGDYIGAIQDNNKAIELDPSDALAYYNRGNAKLLLGYRKDGCLDLSKAGELGQMEAYDSIREYCQ